MNLALDTPLGAPKPAHLNTTGWTLALVLAAAAHGAAAFIWFYEAAPEPVLAAPAPEEQEMMVMLTPPAPPAVEAAAPPPPPPPPDIELPDMPEPEPSVPLERADEAPPPMEITAREFADPEDEPVRRASTTTAAREGGSGDPRFTADQYQVFRIYLREVQMTYAGQLRYPRSAERERLQGRGVLRVRVTRDGRVQDWILHQSVGHGILDREVERSARRVRRLPPLPDALPYETLLIDVPISYQIIEME